ncbi:predicted protein [Plenodomus lingam JN3]|uniref:Predicted protein n=1 Tax=Leptosphaeria maculans (strain JN3 / isolate v23.1.3 / race Av1-4-5-6-7-8) TaxID=985895 RepID=E4ZI04_LEPMJ|nr:predicted protein [Plenodomus lingam JN3]CBX91147.1 predicted protein [Plenodomus lingam JN3]
MVVGYALCGLYAVDCMRCKLSVDGAEWFIYTLYIEHPLDHQAEGVYRTSRLGCGLVVIGNDTI